MTPGEELAAAADKLDTLIAQATDGPWVTAREIDGYRADRWTVVRAHGKRVVTVDQIRTHHDGNGMAEANVAYIAAMNPLVGAALVDWLRSEAQAFHGGERRGFDGADLYRVNPRCMALARLLLGEHSSNPREDG